MAPKNHDPLDSEVAGIQEKLKNRPLASTLKKQRLMNELLESPDMVKALAKLSKKKGPGVRGAEPSFKSAEPPKVSVTTKNRMNPKSANAIYRPSTEENRRKQQKAKFQKILNRLPQWMAALRSSEERHQFALKCFSAIYAQGLWFESLGGGEWACVGAYGFEEPVTSDSIRTITRSSFAIEAMETHKVISAPRGWMKEVFASTYPIHFFVIEQPTLEKRSFFCFSGIQDFDDIQQFVIRSALYEFQKDY